jgi:hypothetical protein
MNSGQANGVSQGTIAFCALATGVYTFLVGIIPPMMLPIPYAPLRWLLGIFWLGFCFWFYPSVHASIGRETAAAAIHLSNKIDSLYSIAEGNRWGSWSHGDAILFGTHWPLTWIWLVFLCIAVVIGQSFKSVWKI